MDSSIAVSPSPKTSGVDLDTLPEKYGILCEFFDGLDSAIRLLNLKRSIPSFTNIYPKVECLTDRRFFHSHLAQLKHIFPEAIDIKRMLIFDERTSCMKSDLHVSIIFNSIFCGDESESETKNVKLRRVFRSRVAEYCKAHPEVFFCAPQPSDLRNSNSKLGLQTLVDAVDDRLPVVASHFPRSFRKQFSGKIQEVEKCSKVSLQSSNFQVAELCDGKSVDSTYAPIQTPIKLLAKSAISEPSSKLFLPATPIKEIYPLKVECKALTESDCNQSTPARLMIATPSLQSQKRWYMSPDGVSSHSSNELFRRTPRTRSLKFEEEKIVDDIHMGGNPVDTDDEGVLSILPESLLHSYQ